MYNSVLEAIFAHSEETPDKLCLADEGRKVTYAEYKQEILRGASLLVSLGVKRDDKVVIEATQTIDYLALQQSMALIGAIFVPVERGCAWNKIVRIAKLSEAVIAITVNEAESDETPSITMEKLVSLKAEAVSYSYDSLPNKEDVSEILFSTGTTGKEKGIVLSHENNIALAENVIYGVEMKEDNVELIPSPMNHSHGLRRYYGNMVKGASVVLISGVMAVKRFFAMMDEYGVNSIDLVPTALTVLLKLSKSYFAKYSEVLRYIQFGSAALMADDMVKIRELLPKTRLYNFYGSTESGCICIYDFNNDNYKEKCLGKGTYNAKIVIVDEDRNEIVSSAENTGTIASYGKMNMVGYWRDEEETARAMEKGFVYSNDEAYIDEDGEIIMLGRKGDVINTGGNKVAPDEVEGAAKKLDIIADCGCIGVPDPMRGNAVKLFVQMKPGISFDEALIHSHLTSLLEPYKVPTIIVEIDEIPRTFNGKLLRRVLKEIQ